MNQSSEKNGGKNRYHHWSMLSFSWVRSNIGSVGTGSALYNAMQYSLNQERYLRAFLDDPLVPLDNNNAEIAIQTFALGGITGM